MQSRAQRFLDIAAGETTHPNEALNAIRKLRDHVEKHGWGGDAQPQTIRGREVAQLRSEVVLLRDEVERLTAELAKAIEPPLTLEERVREAVATSRTKTEAATKLGWPANSYSFRRLDAYGFDQSHFVGQAWRRGRTGN